MFSVNVHCPRPHILFGQAGQEAVAEHVLKLPCSDSLTLQCTVYTVPWSWCHRTGAAALDNWTHTSHPHHPWPAGGWGWCEAAWRQAGLLTSHYTASTALVTRTLPAEDLER